MMRRLITLLIFICLFTNTKAIEPWRRHYHLALNLSNPLGALSKGGAGLETRTGNFAQIVGYTKYWGAFEGHQMYYELQKYIRTQKPHQYYLYLRSIEGTMTFNNEKLSMLGQTQEIIIGPEEYFGVAIGAGKRYNFNILFFRWHLGLKGCVTSLQKADDDYQKAQNSMFRLFYFTGPGSIIDAGIHLGIQF